jgi:hypothetical protein
VSGRLTSVMGNRWSQLPLYYSMELRDQPVLDKARHPIANSSKKIEYLSGSLSLGPRSLFIKREIIKYKRAVKPCSDQLRFTLSHLRYKR